MKKINYLLATLLLLVSCFPSLQVKAQKITDVSKISPAIYERKVLYDCNGDGILEYLNQSTASSNWRWNDKDGKSVKEISNTSAYRLYEDDILLVEDFNNDEIPDLLLTNRTLALSNGEGYKFINDFTEGSIAEGQALYNVCAVDINHDGKKDIFGMISGEDAQGYTIEYAPVVYLQQSYGKFLFSQFSLSEIPDNASSYSSSSAFSQQIRIPLSWVGGGFSMVAAPLRQDFDEEDILFDEEENSKTKVLHRAAAKTQSMTSMQDYVRLIDMNNDGYLDIINTAGGSSMFSLPDGNYYPASFTGLMDAMDMNEDGVFDVVVFDSKQSQILIDISQSDGSYKEIKLLENGNITAVYCRDLDADGLPDILALAPTNSASFLVFFKNQGNGTFKKYERSLSYKGYYYFSEPCDLMNTGIPILLFTNTVDDVNQIGMVSWDRDFNVQEETCMSQSTQLYIGVNKETKRPAFIKCIDFDGDSKLDIPSILYSRSACVASVATPNNTAPSKVDKPFCVLDKKTGMLRINWNFASDKEQSSCDLQYEVRIGTNATRSDVALHNVDKSRWCIINIGQQPVGNYYISVRAIDPNGMKGLWSDCAVVSHTNPVADFIISKKVLEIDNDYEYEKIGYKRDYYTTDIVVVTSLFGPNVTFSVSPDGTILNTNDGVAQITFNNLGTKTISMTSASGAIVQKQIEVKPFKLQNLKNAGDKNGSDIRFYADLNADGQSEYLYGNIKRWVENQYQPIETLFNSDLSISTPSFLTDKTRNGYPDICKGIRKNGVDYNWLFNNGDLDFEVSNEEIKDTQGNIISNNPQAVDINNDGLIDLINCGSGGVVVYLNQGGGIYEKKSYNQENDTERNVLLTDYDQDGLLDILLIYCVTFKGISSVNDGLLQYQYNMYRNEGNGNFVLLKKGILNNMVWRNESSTKYNHRFLLCDINGDGLDDLVTYIIYRTGRFTTSTSEIFGDITALLGSKTDPYKEELILPGIPMNYDLSNDGKTDFYTYIATNGGHYADSLLISQGEQYVKMPADVLFYTRDEKTSIQDVNNDNTPDFITNGNYPYSLLSNYTNTAPTTPMYVTVSQTNDVIIVNWNAATDSETSSSQLYYNLSVKEKGVEGNGAYVISPMNATRDEAKVLDYGINHLRRATRYPIPISSFKAGKTYEFCVQAVDPWMMHSPFSQKVEFTVPKANLISMPEVSGVGIPVSYTLNDINGKTPMVTASDAIMSDGALTWNTPGIKIVTAKAGTVTAQQQINILDKPDLNISIPEKVMAGATITAKLPEVFRTAADHLKFDIDKNAKISMQGDSVAIINMPTIAGTYPFVIVYQDSIFGIVKEVKDVTIVDARPTIVSVGNDNGKNTLKWDTSEVDASLVNKVRIYKETNLAGSYEMIAEVDVKSGQYTDARSNPDIQSYNYRMTYIAKDGIEGLPSPICSTVLLMVNKGDGNDINLHWTPYEGAEVEKYTILMGASTDHLTPIATVSGDRKSYLVERVNNAKSYFALQYTLTSNASSSFSNTIDSDDAYDVIEAASINIQCAENEAVLNEDQMQIHLQAVVAPMSAHLADVAWSITNGTELAKIDAHGVLSIKENNNGGVVTVEASTIDGSDVKATIEVDVASYQWIASKFEGGGVFVNAIQNGEFKALQTEGMPMLDMRNLSNSFAVVSFKAQTTGPVQMVKARYRVYEVEKPMNSWTEISMIEDENGNWMSPSEEFLGKMLRMTEGQDYVLEFYYEGTNETGDVFSYNNGGENYHFMFNCVKPKPEYLVKKTSVVFGKSHVVFLINGVERSFDYEEDGNPNEIVDLGAIQSYVLTSYWNAWNSHGYENLRYKIEVEGSGGGWKTIASEKDSRFIKIDNQVFYQWYKDNIDINLLEGLEMGKKYRLEISGESSVLNENYYNDYYSYNDSGEGVSHCPFYAWKNGESSVFTFTIKDPSAFIPGDANGDGEVNVFDVTATVNYILGTPYEGFVFEAADVNGDDVVNVFDVTKVVNIILGVDVAEATRRGVMAMDDMGIIQVVVEGENQNLVVDKVDRYIAMQFDVVTPAGQSMEAVTLNNTADHILSYQQIDPNRCRVIAYSMENANFEPTKDALVSLMQVSNARIENAVFVTADGRCISMIEDGVSTSVEAITQIANSDAIYNLSGQYMGANMKELPKGVYIQNYKKFIVK